METPERLLRLGLKLEYTTLAWNVVGAVVAIAAAVRAHSVALIGFGLDSLIEIGASTVVVWQLRDTTEIERERRALRLIGTAFFAVALYVLVQSCRTLLLRLRPNSSLIGIAWLAVTFVAMLALAFGKSRTGAKLNNPVLKTEARVTLVDAYLAFSVLVGLLLNSVAKWWWADPVSALVIVFYGFKEGSHAWTESRLETS